MECDRCLEELKMPIDVAVRLSVKFGEADSSEEIQDGEREVIFLSVDNADLDMMVLVGFLSIGVVTGVLGSILTLRRRVDA